MPNFFPFLIYLFVTTFTPGPNNIVSMSNGMRDGYRKSLPFLGGIFTGFLVVILLCGWLNIALVSLLPQVKGWLNLLGAAYMLYLAVHILFSKPAAAEDNRNRLNTFLAGFSMQFLNLKVILYGITIYSTFIIPAFPNPFSAALFAPLLAGVGYVATSCWAVGGDLLSKWISGHYCLFNAVMSALLVYTAISSLLHG